MQKWLFFIGPLILLLAACNHETENFNHDQNQWIHVRDSEDNHNRSLSNTEQAQYLAELAVRVPNVNDATAIVFGPYTVVGIDVDKDLDRARVGTIKYSVAEALKQDIYGRDAVVVADGDVVERIRRLSYKISQGHPDDAILDELGGIVGRYMPETPPRQPHVQEPDQNERVIPDDEEQDLNQIEHDQSTDRTQ
ncbi:YhcN/YlaJ family sporulation lipoprotein [Melghiribacillus thermohalophilus]|uniref:YhcN/YlaJ family sporulation lipoprotein n=1 Tax=Melghiribacillus thermohalophilus TaxID=1324956 RepID=A0A4R3NB99_9BACI|nr:YhcN/YlaJ family sporulation lipoprotein [Melghiribacillus thermohalophilus]TCT26919.1 YhcN/YlaJ family sporulation lipoprotein [Melghiribacillus thermohalophilus]